MATTIWPPWVVTSHRRGLEDLKEQVLAVATRKDEPEVLSAMARLLIIRTSGFVEQSIHELSRAFVAGRSGGIVRTFAQSWMERSKNPTPEALLGLLGRFDTSLETEFQEFLDKDDQHYRRALSFIVDRRNKIAHGLNEGLGHERALALIPDAFATVDWFILKLNPYR